MIFGFTWMELLQLGVAVFIGLFLLILLLATIVRLYYKITCPMFSSVVDLTGKTVLITGANSGIGKETARYMAKYGARVIMACRTMSTARAVRDEISAEYENSKIVLHHVDLSSFQSVRQFCAKIIETETKIDILIHNAGYVKLFRHAVGADGIEYTMASNFYGPFLMTHLLMDLLKKSAPCRIVNVSSKFHAFSTLDPEDPAKLNPVSYWFPGLLYNNSKLAIQLTTAEIARRLEGTGVTINSLHPGAIDSGIWRNFQSTIGFLVRLFMKTLNEGIQTTLFVSLSTSLDNVNGQYFRNCKVGTMGKKAHKMDWQKLMYEESVKIVGLTEKDPKV